MTQGKFLDLIDDIKFADISKGMKFTLLEVVFDAYQKAYEEAIDSGEDDMEECECCECNQRLWDEF